MVTVSIIEPPVRNTGISSRISGRPQSTPTPSGPSILWPLQAIRSTPRSATSTGRCGTDWQASSTASAPTTVSPVGQLAHRVDGAEDVGGVGEREDLGALGQQTVEAVQVEPALVGDRHPAQGRAGAARQLLPRDEVGVVLHLGDEHLVARAQGEPRAGASPATGGGVGERVGREVQALGRVLGEHHLVVPRPDERRDGRPRPLVELGALLGQLVRAAVDRRVVPLVELPLGVEDDERLLRGGPGVEVHQRFPVTNGALEDREVGPDADQLLVRERLPRQLGRDLGREFGRDRSGGERRHTDGPSGQAWWSSRQTGSGRSPRPRGGRPARGRPPRRCGRRRRRGRSRAGCSAGCACSA